MSQGPPDHHRYDDDPELLAALGEVVVEASRLEHEIAVLVGTAWDQDTDWLADTLSKTGGARRALTKLSKQLGTEPGFPADVASHLIWVGNLLDDRSDYVHSVAMWDVSDEANPKPVWWQPRRDHEHMPDVSTLRKGGHLLRRARNATMELTDAAYAWRAGCAE